MSNILKCDLYRFGKSKLLYGLIRAVLIGEYTATIISGLFMYAALGAVICLLSMLIKSSTASTIVCLFYVLFSETLASAMRNIGNFSATVGWLFELGIRYSVYGMSTLASSTEFSPEHTIIIVLNSLAIILLSTIFGLIVFRKYEL